MSSPDDRADRLTQVRSQVDYHHQRLVSYQRIHGLKPCMRLAELEGAYRSARDRLAGLADTPEAPERATSAREPRG
jgi:hypothetical protein